VTAGGRTLAAAVAIALLAGRLALASPQAPHGSVSLRPLESGETLRLTDGWRYREGDGIDLVAADVPDSGWPSVAPRLAADRPPGFRGRAVFRTRLDVPASLAGRPLALRLRQRGASEVYVDGTLSVRYGDLGSAGRPAVTWTPIASSVLTLAGGEHVLAIRYACPDLRALERVGAAPGFTAEIGLAERVLPEETRRAAASAAATWLFTGVFLAFALLHGALYAFHRELHENLWFALLCASNAVLAYFLFGADLATDPRFVLWSEPVMNVAGLLFALSLVLFVRETFGRPSGRTLVAGSGLALLLVGGWAALRPAAALTTVFLVMLAACAETFRAVAVAVVRRREGARLVGTGAACLAAGFAVGLLAFLGVAPRSRLTTSFVPFGSLVAMLVFTSLHLSRRVAATNHELRRRLAEIERLSAEKLESERRARREEVARSLLAAEVARKTEELEEARRLQTSMLPKELPRLSNLAVAARMTTATEVGGDYYDFDVAENGSVTIAIGDATGHGLRAGTLVTATKGLFGALAREPELPSALARSAAAIRRMRLRLLTMALTLVRVEGGAMRVAAAGMPPVLVHRAGGGALETVSLGGMPLGALAGFPYVEERLELRLGDTVLLMSDGLPEMLNGDDEMLGYDRVGEVFQAHAGASPSEIADGLLAAGDAWASGRPQEDDVTLVVLRRLA